MSAVEKFTVSGPQGERTSPSAGPALSLAITLTCRLDDEGSHYVRDPQGVALYRVTREENGDVTIHENGAI